MSTRLRVLLLSFALVVVATIMAAAWADAPLNSIPAVSFAVNNVTNYMGKTAVIAVVNHESCTISLTGWEIELGGPREYQGRPSGPKGTNLPGVARRNTWFNRLCIRAAKLPRVGGWIKIPPDYLIASELFSP